MIRLVEPVFRPPSEARSLILQATLGCSHNRCAFCVSYRTKRFKARPEAELFAEIDWAGIELAGVRKVFLADGDALALSTDRLVRILERIGEKIPSVRRVSAYACPQNLARKSDEEFARLRAAGLRMLYIGVESGDDEILTRIDKGVDAARMVELCRKPLAADIRVSLTVILGLGGPRLSQRHAENTARVISAIHPTYASALTLMLAPRQPSFEEAFGDPAFRELDPFEILAECRTLIAGIDADPVIFHANHASNYLPLSGTLQRDTPRLLAEIDAVLDDPAHARLRPEWLRGL